MDKVVIIGGGISGLSAGYFALKKGYEVTIVEKSSHAGGLCTSWYRGNVLIDGCIHWISGCKDSNMAPLYKELGLIDENNLIELPYFFKFYYDGKEITIHRDIKRLKEELTSIALPEDKKKVDLFFQYLMKLNGMPLYTEMPFSIMTKLQMISIIKKYLPYAFIWNKLSKISILEYANSFKSKYLRKLFLSFMPSHFSASYLIGVFSLFVNGNADIVNLSSQDFSNKLLDKFLSLGGKIVYNEEIKSLKIENDRVISVLGDNEYKADYFISACPLPYFYLNVLPKKYHLEYTDNVLSNLEKYPIISTFYVAFRVDEAYTKEIPHYFIINIPGGFHCGESVNDSIGFRSYPHLRNEDGSQTVICLIDQCAHDFKYWQWEKENGRYERRKKDYANVVLKHLLNWDNSLRDYISIVDIATPLTFNKFTNAYNGAYLSHMTTPHSGRRSFEIKASGLDNLYLASQWVETLGGIPTAISQGLFAVQTMEYYKRQKEKE